MCLSLPCHPKLLLSLLNVTESQTARDAVAVSRTELYALLFVNALEITTNPFTDDAWVDDEEEDDDTLCS